jgi:protein SCO1/2
VCPTTLARLTRLRDQANGRATLAIVFVTIDPEHDGPKEVGQYATLFNAPIIGLTGSQAQIDQIKKQYGIFAKPSPDATPGMEMEHTATVLLFDRDGKLAGTIATDENDAAALAKLKRLTA